MTKTKRELKRIRNYVEATTGIDVSLRSRNSGIPSARALYFILAKEATGATHVDIAESIGYKHCMVTYALYKFRPEVEETYKEEIKNFDPSSIKIEKRGGRFEFLKLNRSYKIAEQQKEIAKLKRENKELKRICKKWGLL